MTYVAWYLVTSLITGLFAGRFIYIGAGHDLRGT